MTNPQGKLQPSHRSESLTLLDRTRLSLCGVTNVISFDETAVVLEMEESTLTVEGEMLHVSKLSLEEGVVEVEGRVCGLFYSDGKSKQKISFWKKWGK